MFFLRLSEYRITNSLPLVKALVKKHQGLFGLSVRSGNSPPVLIIDAIDTRSCINNANRANQSPTYY
jgi:hypothetical protein